MMRKYFPLVMIFAMSACVSDFGGSEDDMSDAAAPVYDAGPATDAAQDSPDTASGHDNSCGDCPEGEFPELQDDGECICVPWPDDNQDAGHDTPDNFVPDTNTGTDTNDPVEDPGCPETLIECESLGGDCVPPEDCPDTGYDAGTTSHDAGADDCGQCPDGLVKVGCTADNSMPLCRVPDSPDTDAGASQPDATEPDAALDCGLGYHEEIDILGNRYCARDEEPDAGQSEADASQPDTDPNDPDAGVAADADQPDPTDPCAQYDGDCRLLPGSDNLCICDPVEDDTDAGSGEADAGTPAGCPESYVVVEDDFGHAYCVEDPDYDPDPEPEPEVDPDSPEGQCLAMSTDYQSCRWMDVTDPYCLCEDIGSTADPVECASGWESWGNGACALAVPDYSEPADNPCAQYGHGDSRICILDRSGGSENPDLPDGLPETLCISMEGMVQRQADANGQGAPYDHWGNWATEYIAGEETSRSYSDLFGHLYTRLGGFVVADSGPYDYQPDDNAKAYVDRGYLCKEFNGRNFEAEVTFVSQYSRHMSTSSMCPDTLVALFTHVSQEPLGICPVDRTDVDDFAWYHLEVICANPRVGTLEERICLEVSGGWRLSIRRTQANGLDLWVQ